MICAVVVGVCYVKFVACVVCRVFCLCYVHCFFCLRSVQYFSLVLCGVILVCVMCIFIACVICSFQACVTQT